MGLFKKFFSIGSRKSKKRSPANPCMESLPPVQEHLTPGHDGSSEAAVSRLLRSSSGRCMPDSQIGLDSLPPFPHPIDSVIPRPKSSSTTIASVSARSTYSVIIRSRTVHSRTEFPNAYPPMDETFSPKRSLTGSARHRSKSVPITPRDKNRLMLLRQDPSVASLLNHYDDEGHLNSTLFSNTPSPDKGGRIQRHRTGSTLRQLLGHPSSPDLRNSMEGDISWAEKFLGETDGNSSVSSIGPRTPIDTHFTHTHSPDDKTTLSVECDTSATNHQTFSSLEVELSASTDYAPSQELDSSNANCVTPQRASQIFGFLGDKKRAHDGPISRLPQPKTATRRFSAESSTSDTKHSQMPLPRRNNTCIFQPTSPTSQRRIVAPLLVPCDVDEPRLVLERPLSMQSALSEKSDNEDRHPGVARSHGMHSQIPKLRTPSGSSSGSVGSKYDRAALRSPRAHPICLQPGVPQKSRPTDAEPPTGVTPHGKGNDVLSRLPQPVTPVRLFGLHSYHLREPPSPASSSELSPIAKQMMANLREQRMDARLRERQAGRLGSGQSRIRY